MVCSSNGKNVYAYRWQMRHLAGLSWRTENKYFKTDVTN